MPHDSLDGILVHICTLGHCGKLFAGIMGTMILVEGEFVAHILLHMNSVFSILVQLGVGKPFHVLGYEETWNDYFGKIEDAENLDMIKTYIYMKVKIVFDPPASGSVMEALKNSIAELESRINMEAETPMY